MKRNFIYSPVSLFSKLSRSSLDARTMVASICNTALYKFLKPFSWYPQVLVITYANITAKAHHRKPNSTIKRPIFVMTVSVL